jgi:hypothetical protein
MVMDDDDVVSGDDGWKELELLPKKSEYQMLKHTIDKRFLPLRINQRLGVKKNAQE